MNNMLIVLMMRFFMV